MGPDVACHVRPKEFPPYPPAEVNNQAAGGDSFETLGSEVSSVDEASANNQTARRDPFETSWVRIEKRLAETPSTVLLLVGHQPAIDWLLADHRVDGAVALAAAEVACLAHPANADDAKWHLWWMLTPSESAAIEPLRQKISSKMTVLSVLAGFSLAVIGVVLVALPDDTVPRLLAAGATTCFASAAAMYVYVLLAYDELMMPHRFWREERRSLPGRTPSSPGPVARPPSSAGIFPYQHMVALWRWAMAALVLPGVGVVLLGVSAAAVNSATAGPWQWRCSEPCLESRSGYGG